MPCDAPTLAAAAELLAGIHMRGLLAVQTAKLNTNAQGPSDTPQVLETGAKAFRALSEREHLVIDTYLYALKSGDGVDPAVLIDDAYAAYGSISHRQWEAGKAYYIALAQGGTTTAQDLETAAAPFGGYSRKDHLAAQTYLLALINGVTTVPQGLLNAAADFQACSDRDLQLIQLFTLCDWSSTPPCTDVPADHIPVVTPHYVNGNLSTLDIFFPQVCCSPGGYWIYGASNDAQLQQGIILPAEAGLPYTAMGVDVTGIADSVGLYVKQYCFDLTFSGASNTVASTVDCGTASTVVVVSGAGVADANGDYVFDQTATTLSGIVTFTNPVTNYYIEFTADVTNEATLYDDLAVPLYRLLAGQCFPCGTWTKDLAIPPAGAVPTAVWGSAGLSQAEGWAARVVTNGGARPSSTSINAAATFYDALVTAGIDSKMKAVNFHAPDSLIAATTPFIKVVGIDPWTNTGPFVSADLTVNGLIGNGTSKFLNIGWTPSGGAIAWNDMGATTYVTVNANTGNHDFGVHQNATFDSYFGVGVQSGLIIGGIGTLANANLSASIPGWLGYLSVNRLAANNLKLFKASSTVPHAIGASTNATDTSQIANWAAPVIEFGSRRSSDGTTQFHCSERLSFMAIHQGLTESESSSFYNAVQALRTALGGGYV